MNNDKLNQIATALKEEETKLLAAKKQLSNRMSACDAELKQIRSAINSLSTRKRTKAKQSSSSKPAASKEIVSKLVADVQTKNPGMDSATLKSTVEGLLRSNGYSLAGFALRFKEVSESR